MAFLISKLRKVYSQTVRNHFFIPPKPAVVTILEASTKVGRYAALLLKQNPLISELRLYDRKGSVCSVAEDLSHIDTNVLIKSFGNLKVLKEAIKDADIVISTGGCRKSYRETIEETFEKNIEDVQLAVSHMVEFNPKAIFCVAKPPVEIFVPYISEEYKKAGVYDSRKIIGLATVGSMRANSHIGAYTKQNPKEVLCPIVGGVTGECLVSVFSQSQPRGKHLPKDLQKAIANSENDILKLYGETSPVCLAPAAAISRFVNMILKARKGDTNCVDCAFIRQTGHIGHFLPYMTSIVRFGRHGVMSSHMPNVSGEEAHLLRKASLIVREYINMGEEFVTGSRGINLSKKCESGDNKKKPKTLPVDCSKPVLRCSVKTDDK